MQLFTYTQLKRHDVYEFCYDKNYPKHWNKDSLFMTFEDFGLLSPYLDELFKDYDYYGPEKIMIKEWDILKKNCLNKEKTNMIVQDFFIKIDEWIKNEPNNKEFFWIYGV